MDPFIVNLMDNNGERYLKLAIQLEISDPKGVAELDQMKPKLRDNVLDLLSAKSVKELMDMAGKQRLREEIAMRLNTFLTTGKVSKVYFTEFVIQ
jgi:flagellar FliL protein